MSDTTDYVDRINLTDAQVLLLAGGHEQHLSGETGAWTHIDGSKLSHHDIQRLVAGHPVEARNDDGLFLLHRAEGT